MGWVCRTGGRDGDSIKAVLLLFAKLSFTTRSARQ